MPCSKVSINKNNKCDKAGCICIPVNGKTCICLCENEQGDIMQCDDCKCLDSDDCQCKCDDSKCTCIVAIGANCICVCHDGRGNFKACEDCSCDEIKDMRGCKKESSTESCCSKTPIKETCGENCKCDKKNDYKVQRRVVTTSNTYKCDKDQCVCLPTDGKSCICVCEDDDGTIVRCDDCKCNNNGKCQCKCDDSNCTCILTKGADCICVCRDGRGNWKACDDCSCAETKTKGCCNEKSTSTVEPSGCCSKATKKETCGRNCECNEKKDEKVQRRVTPRNYKCDKAECVCLPTGGKSCICICEDDSGAIVRCDDCKCNNNGKCQCKCDDSNCTCILTKGADCICVCRDRRGNLKACDDCSCGETKAVSCCNKKSTSTVESCGCCTKAPKKETCGRNCECNQKKDRKLQRRPVTFSKNYKCDKAECVCLPTDGKSCICVCENDDGDIVRCDDCKCYKNGNCECKCDDSKCTCIVTYGADCICVCRDGRDYLQACDNCSCVETKSVSCCNKRSTSIVESCECCSKAPKKEACGRNCEFNENKDDKVQRRSVTIRKNYKCDKAECVCLPTNGKSCICVCENDDGAIVRCDDCKCSNTGKCQCKGDDSKCTCIATNGADCICICRDETDNLKACGDCSCVEIKTKGCCNKRSTSTVESCGCCSKSPNKETYGRNCECNEKKDEKVQRRSVTIRNNDKCDKAECVSLPTGGKPCICVCEDDNGEIVRCDGCKCYKSGNCECQCDDSKCTCIVTKGADCICVCRDGRGNLKACDNCSCIETKAVSCCNKRSTSTIESCGCCTKAPKKDNCGRNSKCNTHTKDGKVQRRSVTTCKSYKCDKAECVCLPTGGKSCICVCEDDSGAIVRCGDCKCNNNGKYQCKCDDSNCTCILTKGADCICVCRDGRGILKACDDCSCVETKAVSCCNKRSTSTVESPKSPKKETCGRNCECNEKKDSKVQRRSVTFSKNYKCDKTECICLPTGGKSCICVCEDDNGDIVRCDDCKCYKNGNCDCTCDDSKCTCIVTEGADCICVCRDRRGNLKACDDCSCVETTTAGCGTKRSTFTVESCGCCNKVKKETSRPYEVNNGPYQRKDCTCCSRNTCYKKLVNYENQTKSCGQNYKYANNKEEYEPRGGSFKTKDLTFCCKETNQYNKLDGYNTRASETSQCCDNPKQTSGCCRAARNQEKILKTRGCICTYKQISYRQIVGDGSVGVTKSCACYY